MFQGPSYERAQNLPLPPLEYKRGNATGLKYKRGEPNHGMNETLYNRTRKIGLHPTHVAEVGVHYPETSNVLLFIEEGCRADLFEPDPLCVERIREKFADNANVTIHPYAIYHTRTTLGLYRANSSTFVKDLTSSPALVNDRYQPNEKDLFEAEARTFGELDDGTIDLLSVDTEGCEWYVIQTMKSRPAVISLETHGKRYKHPHIKLIEEWMRENNYRVWYRDKSDTVYVRREVLPGFWDRMRG
jgi:FkbM family methyltransferase